MSIDRELREMMAAPNATTRVFRRLGRWRKQPAPVAVAMQEAFGLMQSYQPRAPWRRLAAIDWDADRAEAAHWLQETLIDRPLPVAVRGIWVSAPEFGQGAKVTISGCPDFSTNMESCWSTEVIWPGETEPVPAFRSRVIAAVEKIGGRSRSRDFLDYSIPYVYSAVLMLDLLPLISPRLTLGQTRRRGVACGFNSGDWQTVGILATKGWSNG